MKTLCHSKHSNKGLVLLCWNMYVLIFRRSAMTLTDIDKKVHSLREFLGFVDKHDALESFNQCGFFTKIAKDVASGLCYLHSKDIVHRDLQTANVLVSNQHYSNMTSEEDFSKALQENPVMCKVTDFGESRSRLVQTALVVHSRTQRLNRGTPVFLAPEAFLSQPEAGMSFSISDMKKVDIGLRNGVV